MPRARKHLVSVANTPYYHVSSRCVRRAFLCGIDRFSGRSYEHRRQWIVDRIRVLSSLFSIDICAYAVMNNHYHLVVKLIPEEANQWSDDDVLQRWTALFKGPLLVQRQRAGETLSAIEREAVSSMAAVYRSRLSSLSWFMKCLNEPIARKANAEDHCSGHFWEARFHSQALCSEKALFAAMAYVDLNPIRAKMAKTPETSDYTSIRTRILGMKSRQALTEAVSRLISAGDLRHFETSIRPLMPFAGDKTSKHDDTLPMVETDYLILVDNTARIVVHNKRGYMDAHAAPILERLGLSGEQWISAAGHFTGHYRNGDLRLKQTA